MPSPETQVPPDRLYTLADLESWTFAGPSLAVIGHPVAHSLSPAMHRAALAELAKTRPEFAQWSYFRIEVAADQLPEALPLFRARGFVGLNLTVPHKVHAVDLVTEIDPMAKKMGAVNTIAISPDGFHGYNSDGPGLSLAVQQELQTTLGARDVLIMGAGGAARAAAVQALEEGCPRIWIGNRSYERLHDLLKTLLPPVMMQESRVKGFLFDELPDDLPSAPLIINATTQGLKPADPLPMSLDRFGEGTKIYDTTYGCANAWSRTADANGWAYADGIGMLVAQGVISLERWTQCKVSQPTMRSAVALALAARLA
ncbi:MAG: shikimate dehydrogenase [Verrucomicrobiota bacterium JB022]|nr:shikimate dehydrogenase [Verrucomicrobiota bacterium JB022]